MSVNEKVFEKKENESLSEYLIRAREAKGFSIDDMVRETHISINYMKNIEAGQWDQFPVEAYLRGYLNSISRILDLDSKVVLSCFLKEKGNTNYIEQEFAEKELSVPSERGKKNFFMPILIIVLGIAFLVLMNFVNHLEKDTETPSENPLKNESSEAVRDSEESVESSTLIHDAAELVVLDSLVSDSLIKDSLVKDSLAPKLDSLSLPLDTVAKKKDLPASATIFISSSSKEKEKEQTVQKNTSFELIGSGVTNSWIGLKRHETDNAFLKEANISRQGGRLKYESTDTLYVIIGNPDAIAKMLLNGKEVALPQMRPGMVTRFYVFAGKIVSGAR